MIEDPDGLVDAREAAAEGWIVVGLKRPKEDDDVHGEDAAKGEASQHVDRVNPLCGCDGENRFLFFGSDLRFQEARRFHDLGISHEGFSQTQASSDDLSEAIRRKRIDIRAQRQKASEVRFLDTSLPADLA